MVCNQFFEKPDGTIVKGYGFGPGGIKWYDQHGNEGETPAWVIVEGAWKERPDIKWFPGTPEDDRPTLPYVFDLMWDCKTPSDLRRELADACSCKTELIRDTMKEHGVTL